MFKAIRITQYADAHPMLLRIPTGDEVTVIDETVQYSGRLGKECLYYRIAEYAFAKDGEDAWYFAEAFAPLNGPDERERLEAYLQEQEKMDKILMALAETSDEPMPQDAFDRSWAAIEKHLNRTI